MAQRSPQQPRGRRSEIMGRQRGGRPWYPEEGEGRTQTGVKREGARHTRQRRGASAKQQTSASVEENHHASSCTFPAEYVAGVALAVVALWLWGRRGRAGLGARSIAVFGPMTGPYAATGKQIWTGAKQCGDEINAAGGVLGTQLELVQTDDEGDPGKGTLAAQKITDDLGRGGAGLAQQLRRHPDLGHFRAAEPGDDLRRGHQPGPHGAGALQRLPHRSRRRLPGTRTVSLPEKTSARPRSLSSTRAPSRPC